MCLYVRSLTVAESRKLSCWLKQSRNAVQMRHAQIMSFSGQGMRVQQIAVQLTMHQEHIRRLIRRFNEGGFEAIKAKARSGRSSKLTEEEKSVVLEVATAPPQAFGRPFNQWSLRKLHQFLVEDTKMICPVSYVTLRTVLKEAKMSLQRTRTWKRSNDPDYDAKKNASRGSTRKRPKAAQ